MSDFKRILLATDLSACSRGAEQTALSLARSLGAEVVVLHVVELPPGLDPETVIHPDLEGPARPIREYVTAADRVVLRDLAATFRAAGLAVTHSISVGPIAATVIEQARTAQAELIVIGTHGRSGLRRAVLGSIAEQLIRQSQVPVLVVRRDAEDTIPEADEQARIEAEG